MCGIAGFFSPYANVNKYRSVESIISKLHHRGPDFFAIKNIDNYCTLGHTRLSIIDLSDAAHQPMYCYQKRFVITFNGEIYNYKQLKLKLQQAEYKSAHKPYPFHTNSDTEVILAAYHRWGKDCVKYLDGMFAFAIYDTHSHTLFVARDRQGKKPFYFIHHNNYFAFASEIQALLHSDLSSKQLNLSQLYDYFQYQTTFAPHTLIQDIQLLEAAHTFNVYFDNQNKIIVEKNKYWQPIENTLSANDITYDEAKNKLRQLLLESVEKRLISDVPVGAFLSGGIDSSVIVGIIKKYFSKQIDTFHITTQFSEFSENKYAESLAEDFNTHHHNIVLTEKEVLELVPEGIQKMDYPTGDGINTYIVSHATKKAGITVALSGIGGDELFAGYPQFKIIKKLHSLRIIDFPIIRKNLFNFLPENFFHSAYRLKILMNAPSLEVTEIFPYYRRIFQQNKLPLIAPSVTSYFDKHLNEKYLLDNKHILTYISITEMHNYMQHILLRDTDQMSMANALEVRAPFLDTALVQLVLSLPDEYKYPTTPKKLLTDTLNDLLPKDIIHRKKMGFVLPFKIWMKKDLKNFCDKKIQHLAQQHFIDKNKLSDEWNLYQKGKHNRWWMFWHLIILQNWIEKNNVQVK